MIHKDLECRDLLDEAKSYQLSLAGLTPTQRPYDRMVPRRSCSGRYNLSSGLYLHTYRPPMGIPRSESIAVNVKKHMGQSSIGKRIWRELAYFCLSWESFKFSY